VFVAVARQGSFTAAAGSLGLTKSVVSQHVRTLEERCGVRLFERTTRTLHLTQVGEQVLEAASEMMLAVQAIEQVVEAHRDTPRGTLRVTLPLDPGILEAVGAVTTRLLRQHPSLKVNLDFDDEMRDLVQDGFDVALRLGEMRESSLVVRRLGSEPEILAVNPAALAGRAAPGHPRDLGVLPWLVHSAQRPRSSWVFRLENDEEAQVTLDAAVSVSTVIAMRSLLLHGAGIGLVPRHMIHDDLRSGRLLQVCPGWFRRRIWLHALLPTRRPPPRVRVFLDQLAGVAASSGFDPP
jgi:DNA-binding transcriptional LysR family regulator